MNAFALHCFGSSSGFARIETFRQQQLCSSDHSESDQCPWNSWWIIWSLTSLFREEVEVPPYHSVLQRLQLSLDCLTFFINSQVIQLPWQQFPTDTRIRYHLESWRVLLAASVFSFERGCTIIFRREPGFRCHISALISVLFVFWPVFRAQHSFIITSEQSEQLSRASGQGYQRYISAYHAFLWVDFNRPFHFVRFQEGFCSVLFFCGSLMRLHTMSFKWRYYPHDWHWNAANTLNNAGALLISTVSICRNVSFHLYFLRAWRAPSLLTYYILGHRLARKGKSFFHLYS